ncbi:zinc finger matrin-type protein 5-like isoform X2 [Gigantopelta aegis]|uniref:zinc finger matrin-type protein 5-like isoform X2 n=1 Tax=Gigantopelta aegis TaxID=1735272 RepID=UPI001B887B9C|nr:zinc finger matrin-type protein 5-like isoform X2 [Gigantopelta aegis]
MCKTTPNFQSISPPSGINSATCHTSYPEVILADVEKGICRAFQNTGECNYGDRCHYTHMTNEHRAQLQQQIQKKREAENAKKKSKSELNPSLEAWLSKRVKKMKSEDPRHCSQSDGDDSPQYSLPPSLLGMTNIPPSLLPPPANTFSSLDIQEWG